MNKNTNNNTSKNDNKLDILPRGTEEFDANVQVELQNVKGIIIRYIVHNHYQSITNLY